MRLNKNVKLYMQKYYYKSHTCERLDFYHNNINSAIGEL